MEYKNADGTTTKAVEHRAGWDATFLRSEVSVFNGARGRRQPRARRAPSCRHCPPWRSWSGTPKRAVGGNNPAEIDGQVHSCEVRARYRAPSGRLRRATTPHPYAVIFNVTERADRTTRAIQPQGLFDSQNFATAVYQAELTHPAVRNLDTKLSVEGAAHPRSKATRRSTSTPPVRRSKPDQRATGKDRLQRPRGSADRGAFHTGPETTAHCRTGPCRA